MSPVADHTIDRAKLALEAARDAFNETKWPGMAAREAYVAAHRAAQAFVFEKTGKIAKTHRGVQALFKQTADAAGLDPKFEQLLSRAYQHKQDWDYSDTLGATAADASETIEAVAEMITAIEAALQQP